jgi:chloramphenicol O-acetyltransferase type A
MRKIDLLTWSRREHFELFNTFNHPHFNMCANVDLTKFHPFVTERGFSFTAAIIDVISRAANAVPEFRYRMRDGEVVEHETVSPSVTILGNNDLFGFCTIDYCQDFGEFAARAARLMAAVKDNPTLKNPPGRDDLLFMTAIPWVSFTSFAHPMRLHPADSFPRFAWGKTFEEWGLLKMPLSVQGNHALMDGIHIARFYAELQDYLHHPSSVLGEG